MNGLGFVKICDFLKVFYEATVEFSGSLYPTSNLYFPQALLIHLKLVKELKSPDPYMKTIAEQMWVKFEKYWADFSLLLAIAVVFDPRYNYAFLEFSYKKLYGIDSPQLEVVKTALFGLFKEYRARKKPECSTSSGACNDGDEDVSEGIFKV